MGKVLIFCCTILFAVEIFSFPSKLLYDFSNIGTSLPNLDDVSSPEIKLKVPIVFYGQKYSSIFVSDFKLKQLLIFYLFVTFIVK